MTLDGNCLSLADPEMTFHAQAYPPLDLGDITTARGTEAYLLLWLRLWSATGKVRRRKDFVQAACVMIRNYLVRFPVYHVG